MIKPGIIGFPHPLFGYVGEATQEEAERLSNGVYQHGLIVFVPLSKVFYYDIDQEGVKKEEEVSF